MNKTNVSPLQVYQSRDFNGMTTTNHLSNAYLTEPEQMDSVLSYAFGYQEKNVLSLLTGGIGKTEYISGREYTWKLHLQSERAIEVIETSPDIGGALGRQGTTFRIVLAEKWFDLNDNLISDDRDVEVHVVSEPYQSGNGYVYTVQLNDPNPASFIDPTLISLGARFSKSSTTVGEGSYKGGGSGYSTPIELRNHLTTLRKTYKCTGEAAQAIMVIELFAPDGQSTKYWTKLEEWNNMAKWYRELDRQYIYSRYNKDTQGEVKLRDENGMPIYHGAGLREQIAPANKRPYTRLTYEILNEFLLDLSFSADKWGGNNKFVALTGKMGMREFDRAIKEYAAGNNITVTDNGTFITGSGSELTLTGYFKTVKFMNGIELTITEFPPYDDIIHNRELHPISLKPVESYRFTFLNFGQVNGKSNITKVAMNNREGCMWHVAGSTDPFGGVAKDAKVMRASGFDGYEVHYLDQCGLKVADPLSCGELYLKTC